MEEEGGDGGDASGEVLGAADDMFLHQLNRKSGRFSAVFLALDPRTKAISSELEPLLYIRILRTLFRYLPKLSYLKVNIRLSFEPLTSRALPKNPGAMGKKVALPAAAAAVAVPEKVKAKGPPLKKKGPVMSDEDDEAEEVCREGLCYFGWIAPRVLRVGTGAFGAAGGPD